MTPTPSKTSWSTCVLEKDGDVRNLSIAASFRSEAASLLLFDLIKVTSNFGRWPGGILASLAALDLNQLSCFI